MDKSLIFSQKHKQMVLFPSDDDLVSHRALVLSAIQKIEGRAHADAHGEIGFPRNC